MSRELMVVRHAKSSWSSGAVTDYERPLNARGKRDAPRMGRWMQRQLLVPDYVISSPARRAQQTTRRICRELAYPLDLVHWQPRVYHADLEQLLESLAFGPVDESRVLLVGHNPGLEELLHFLLGHNLPPAPGGKLLPTAALVHLALDTDWQQLGRNSCRLIQAVRPKELPADL